MSGAPGFRQPCLVITVTTYVPVLPKRGINEAREEMYDSIDFEYIQACVEHRTLTPTHVRYIVGGTHVRFFSERILGNAYKDMLLSTQETRGMRRVSSAGINPTLTKLFLKSRACLVAHEDDVEAETASTILIMLLPQSLVLMLA